MAFLFAIVIGICFQQGVNRFGVINKYLYKFSFGDAPISMAKIFSNFPIEFIHFQEEDFAFSRAGLHALICSYDSRGSP